MKLLKSFQDLQNETCEIWIDDLKNYWIGRRGAPKMNIYYQQVNDIFELIKKNRTASRQ